MIKTINIGNKKSTIEALIDIKNNGYYPIDIRITNSHIKELNKKIGKNIFKKDALYISSRTLWEIMQPIGGAGRHHYHGLSPEKIYEALSKMRYSNDISLSYDGRYIVITMATVFNSVPIAIILQPEATIENRSVISVSKIITIYPYNKK